MSAEPYQDSTVKKSGKVFNYGMSGLLLVCLFWFFFLLFNHNVVSSIFRNQESSVDRNEQSVVKAHRYTKDRREINMLYLTGLVWFMKITLAKTTQAAVCILRHSGIVSLR